MNSFYGNKDFEEAKEVIRDMTSLLAQLYQDEIIFRKRVDVFFYQCYSLLEKISVEKKSIKKVE